MGGNFEDRVNSLHNWSTSVISLLRLASFDGVEHDDYLSNQHHSRANILRSSLFESILWRTITIFFTYLTSVV